MVESTKNIVDARGLDCPLPLLKLKLAMKTMSKTERIKILTSDETSRRDFQSFCNLSENSLLSLEQVESYFEFVIEKG